MNKLLFGLLILSACSSWNQKEFDKEMSKTPTEEAEPAVVTTRAEERLLEKFEVTPAKKVHARPSNKVPLPRTRDLKKKPLAEINPDKQIPSKAQAQEKPVPVSIIKPLPKDYPAELLALNSKAQKVWGLYRSNHFVNEKVYLDIHYLGMTVGKVMVLNKGKKMINGKEVWHFHARFKSAPFYSNIYELDDTVDTYVTTDQFLSTRYSLVQRESKQDVDDLQLHDRDQYKTFWFYHQKKSDGKVKDKKLEKPIPYFSIDPFSILFFYQGLPLKNGDIYEIPIINKGKILNLRSEVEGREKVATRDGKERAAIRVHATTKYTGETLKSGDLYFWFSDDERRTLLKAQAKIKIGSVTGEIVDK